MSLQYLRQNATTLLLSLALVLVFIYWGSSHPHTLRLSTTTPAVFMKTAHRHPDPQTSMQASSGYSSERYTWIWQCNSSWRYAHMSMLASLPRERMMAAWQASKSHEGQAMAGLQMVQGLWTAFSPDGGQTWTPPVVAVQGISPAWGPVLHFDAAARKLWLFYSISMQALSAGGDVVYRTTTDLDSANPRWSPPTVILRSEDMDGFPKVTANRLEVLSNGNWLLPIWQEAPPDIGISSVLIGRPDSSSHNGRLWEVDGHMSDPTAGWLIEGTVAELTPATTNRPFVLQLFRTRDKRLWGSKSSDGGRSWWVPEPIAALKNPNSKVALAKVVDANGHQGLVLAYNPSEDARSPLVLAYSVDGFSWTVFAHLEKAGTVPGRWYAYPTVVQHGSMLYCSYTVYDHLEAPDTMGTVQYMHGVDTCPEGSTVCHEDELEEDRQPTVVTRHLRNVFIGIKLAVLPTPSFRSHNTHAD